MCTQTPKQLVRDFPETRVKARDLLPGFTIFINYGTLLFVEFFIEIPVAARNTFVMHSQIHPSYSVICRIKASLS